MTTAEAKGELRARLRAARRGRSSDQRAADSAALQERLLRLPDVAPSSSPRQVLGFLPLPTEPPLLSGLESLDRAGWDVLIPRCLPGRMLEWVRWSPEAGVQRSGLARVDELAGEAVAPDPSATVLVPALAVGAHGVRLGQGGGYYDGFLSSRPSRALTVAVVFDDELAVSGIPADPWDARLETALTPTGWWRLSPPQAASMQAEQSGCPRWERFEPARHA